MKRVQLQPAYVLHRRSYRETSFLVEIFTPEYGRLTVVARGVRKPKSFAQGLLQPFVPLLVSWSGRHELVALSQVEPNGLANHLRGECLFAGFYLNELLMYLLQKWDAHPVLFDHYVKTLTKLNGDCLEQKFLRSFEKCLLEEIGYGLLPKTQSALQQAFKAQQFYRFIPEHGFVISENTDDVSSTAVFSGNHLLSIAQEDWQNEEVLQAAKRLMRLVLTPLLGTRCIYSRQLFTQQEEQINHNQANQSA